MIYLLPIILAVFALDSHAFAAESTWASRPLPQKASRNKSTDSPAATKASPASAQSSPGALPQTDSIDEMGAHTIENTRLACLTAYWSSEGDYYTARGQSSTGVHLHQGHCAVDPNLIPYGSVVDIPGIGKFLAVDTGTAVITRRAARLIGRNSEERKALVIDLYFTNARTARRFADEGPKFSTVVWWTPSSTALAAVEARKLFAVSDWLQLHVMGML